MRVGTFTISPIIPVLRKISYPRHRTLEVTREILINKEYMKIDRTLPRQFLYQ